jgi:hypothetical protein
MGNTERIIMLRLNKRQTYLTYIALWIIAVVCIIDPIATHTLDIMVFVRLAVILLFYGVLLVLMRSPTCDP